jgi:hypothetical protein
MVFCGVLCRALSVVLSFSLGHCICYLYYSYFSTYHFMVENVTNKCSTWVKNIGKVDKFAGRSSYPSSYIFIYDILFCFFNKFILHCCLVFCHYDGYRLDLTSTLNLGADFMSTLVYFLHTSIPILSMPQCSQVGDGIRASMSGK